MKKSFALSYDGSFSESLECWPTEAFFVISLFGKNKTNKVHSKNFRDLKKSINSKKLSWVNCCVENIEKKAFEIADCFGFSENLVVDLLSKQFSAYMDLDSELGLVLPAVKVRNLTVSNSKIIILIKKNLIVSIHPKKVTRFMRFTNYAETFIKKMPFNLSSQDKITILLNRLIDKNNEKNFENLRLIEEEGEKISGSLVNKEVSREHVGADIYHMKQSLIRYLGSLWDSLDVINNLRYGDSVLITDDKKILGDISSLASEIKTQIGLTEHMSEVLSSGLEVIQSIYNNQLQIMNNRLAFMVTWLTVLGTAVLVPNTLATIFGIPSISEHLDWQLTIIILVLSTIFSAWFSYWFIKRKMPVKIE